MIETAGRRKRNEYRDDHSRLIALHGRLCGLLITLQLSGPGTEAHAWSKLEPCREMFLLDDYMTVIPTSFAEGRKTTKYVPSKQERNDARVPAH